MMKACLADICQGRCRRCQDAGEPEGLSIGGFWRGRQYPGAALPRGKDMGLL